MEYTALNDELPIDDDVKGEAKIDALGRLLGGKLHQTCFRFEVRADMQTVNTRSSHSLLKDETTMNGYTVSLSTWLEHVDTPTRYHFYENFP